MLWQHVPYSLRYSNSCMHGFIPWMFCVETHHCCWISPFLTEWFTDPDVQAQVDLVSWGSEADLPQQLGSSWPPVLRLVPQRNHKGWGWIVSFLRKDPLTPPTVSPALTRAAAPLQCVSPPPPHDTTTAAGIHVMSLTLAAEEKDASTVQVFRGWRLMNTLINLDTFFCECRLNGRRRRLLCYRCYFSNVS